MTSHDEALPCPACGFLTVEGCYGSYGICAVCGWEDDGVQLANPACGGGANSESLIEAQTAAIGEYPVSVEVADGYRRDRRWRPSERRRAAPCPTRARRGVLEEQGPRRDRGVLLDGQATSLTPAPITVPNQDGTATAKAAFVSSAPHVGRTPRRRGPQADQRPGGRWLHTRLVPRTTRRHPVHVTLRAARALPSLRSEPAFSALRAGTDGRVPRTRFAWSTSRCRPTTCT